MRGSTTAARVVIYTKSKMTGFLAVYVQEVSVCPRADVIKFLDKGICLGLVMVHVTGNYEGKVQ